MSHPARSTVRVKKMHPLSRRLSVGFMLLNTIVWGAALPLVKPGLGYTTPFRFLFERFALAALLIFPVLVWYFRRFPTLSKYLPRIIALEILGTTISLGLLYSGLSLTTALESSLITTTVPIFTTIGGILFLREKEERREWLGLALAFAGTLLFVVEPVLNNSWQSAEFSLVGNLLVFSQNVAIAAYYLMAKKWYRPIPKLFASGISFWVGALSFGFMSWWEAARHGLNWLQSVQIDLQTPEVILAVLYMAVMGSIIGLTAYIKGQDGMEASEASIYTYLQPLIYIPLTWLMFGERLTIVMIAALGLIALGVVCAESKKLIFRPIK